MSKTPLVSLSPDTQKRSYLFVNVSGETVPPFAIMQICVDPAEWLRAPEASPLAIERSKVFGAAPNRTMSNEPMFYCCKPNYYSAYEQDVAIMAVNSDSEVADGAVGRCFYGEYPIRILANSGDIISPKAALIGTSNGLAITANSWALDSNNIGAYRTIRKEENEVEWTDLVDTPFPRTNSTRPQLSVPNPFVRKISPRLMWTYNGKGEGKFPMRLINAQGDPPAQNNPIVTEEDKQLILVQEGLYVISGCFDYYAYGSPPDLQVVLCQFKLAPVEQKDAIRITLPKPVDFGISRWFTFPDRVLSPLEARAVGMAFTSWYWADLTDEEKELVQQFFEDPEAYYSNPAAYKLIYNVWHPWAPPMPYGKRAWGSVRVVWQGSLIVKKPPVAICIEHTVGEYMQTDGFVLAGAAETKNQRAPGSRPLSRNQYNHGAIAHVRDVQDWNTELQRLLLTPNFANVDLSGAEVRSDMAMFITKGDAALGY
jgi:hypothetical protein